MGMLNKRIITTYHIMFEIIHSHLSLKYPILIFRKLINPSTKLPLIIVVLKR